MLRRTFTALTAVTAVALPVTNAVAAAQAHTLKKGVKKKAVAKKRAVTVAKTQTGPVEYANRWGEVQVVVSYTKTITTVKGKRRLAIKVTKVATPLYPNHTNRSAYISSQAIPLLEQETVQIQPTHTMNTFRLVSGATDTSYAFGLSLQAALLKMGK